MATMKKITSMMVASALLSMPVVAAESRAEQVSYLQVSRGENLAALPSGGSAALDREDRQLAALQADFERFAQTKVAEMNRNHKLSKSRMQINRQKDGSYGAVFHQIDHSSLSCQVRRSQSKSIPYVAVLSYQEEILAASGGSPEECRKGQFRPVGVIPNRHIFSYHKGSWR